LPATSFGDAPKRNVTRQILNDCVGYVGEICEMLSIEGSVIVRDSRSKSVHN
jgi:hypothetical protein